MSDQTGILLLGSSRDNCKVVPHLFTRPSDFCIGKNGSFTLVVMTATIGSKDYGKVASAPGLSIRNYATHASSRPPSSSPRCNQGNAAAAAVPPRMHLLRSTHKLPRRRINRVLGGREREGPHLASFTQDVFCVHRYRNFLARASLRFFCSMDRLGEP